MDAETAAQLERLQSITKMLEEAGYIQRKGDKWELTPRAHAQDRPEGAARCLL